MKELDDIAEEAERKYLATGWEVSVQDVVRSAIDKAIEFVLTREPSDEILLIGAKCLRDFYSDQDECSGTKAVYRAMQAALLGEIKGKT